MQKSVAESCFSAQFVSLPMVPGSRLLPLKLSSAHCQIHLIVVQYSFVEAACTTAGCQTGGVANVTTLDSDTTTPVINVQLPFPINAYFGAGSSNQPIWLYDINCLGTETNVGQCLSGGWGIHNCVHLEDVGRQLVRLASGPTPTEGRVELYYNGSPYDQKG
eukprot:Em0007g912a